MKSVLSLIFFLLVPAFAFGCPLIGGLPDFNCDQEMNVVVIGDSFVYGFGDTSNDNKGGYILRTQKKLDEITITGLGVQGLRTPQLISTLKDVFKSDDKPSITRDALLTADYVILDLGRNDRWYFGEPITTVKNLKSIRNYINKKVKAAGKVSPLIITSVLMLPNRGSQGPWVKALNTLILDTDSDSHPADLRFDLVSKRLISDDQIHPTSKGYQALTRVFVKYLTKNTSQSVN